MLVRMCSTGEAYLQDKRGISLVAVRMCSIREENGQNCPGGGGGHNIS